MKINNLKPVSSDSPDVIFIPDILEYEITNCRFAGQNLIADYRF
jgi:hypothetical protein